MTPDNMQLQYIVALATVNGLPVAFVSKSDNDMRCACVLVNWTAFGSLNMSDSRYWILDDEAIKADMGTHKIVRLDGFVGNCFEEMSMGKIAQLAGVQ